MRLFTRDDLKSLSQSSGGFHISIYMPTHSSGLETDQNPIRFKNLVRSIEDELVAEGVRTPDIKTILDPAYNLLSLHFFWKHMQQGLAFFISPGKYEFFHTSHSFREFAVLTHRFHLKPLLPLLSREEQFYILAFSQESTRLLHCNRDQIEEIEVEGLPKNMQAMFNDKNQESHTHHHYMGSGAKGNLSSVLHGGDDGSDQERENLKKYFRKIDQEVSKVLQHFADPLILATVDANVPIYREVNSYPHLFEHSISGNPDHMSAKDLLEKGFPLVRPFFKKERSEAEDRYHTLKGTGKTSDQLEEIVRSSKHGLIDTLFVARETEKWGIVDEALDKVSTHDQFEPGDEDLLSYACIQTLINKGTVFSIMPEFMPNKGVIAAILRY